MYNRSGILCENFYEIVWHGNSLWEYILAMVYVNRYKSVVFNAKLKCLPIVPFLTHYYIREIMAGPQEQNDKTSSNEKTEQYETSYTEHVIINEKKVDDETGSRTSTASVADMEKGNGFQEPFVKSETEKKFVRKISYTLVPFVIGILMLQVMRTLKLYLIDIRL